MKLPTIKMNRCTPLFVAMILTGHISVCQVKLPRLIRDSMILQRDAKIRIWGWAGKNEKVSIHFGKQHVTTKATPDGKWTAWLPPMKAGGPYTMHISASNKITLKDILIGDVWICSGQSNMVHQMELHSVLYGNDIAAANYPQIRHFWVENKSDVNGPRNDLSTGSWKWANPEDVRSFSAVAYFFARHIYEKYKVPIGLINASVGGTPIEAWMSEEALTEFPSLLATIQKNKDTAFINTSNRMAAINRNRPEQVIKDKGLAGPVPWYSTAYVPKGWHRIAIPGYWEDQGVKDLNGVVWYRKEINIPATMANKPLRLFLGRIVDADVAYVNGQQVGSTGYMYPQRRYNIPAGLMKAGKNLLVVKITNTNGKGGFVPDKPYYLFSGKDTIDLTGYWDYKVGEVFEPRNARQNTGIALQNQPTALFNAMIAPLENYTIKGFLWYQGESNTGRAEEYARLQSAQIHHWRKEWNQGELPFLFVQLPNFMDVSYLPVESQWARFRESQLKSLAVPNTAMAVAIDLGEWNDIHPDNKKAVGERLALAAQKLAYGEKDIVYSGPLFKLAVIEKDRITLSFDHTGSGLMTVDGEPLSQFAIAGADKKFVWANAQIEGNKVIVWNDLVPAPLFVRYAWADNPDGANLYNKEGLPASPFRTDE
jgi:sialate O-acetylesterase